MPKNYLAIINHSVSHQKQALSFMKRREKGWRLDSPSADIWGIDRQHPCTEYINNITGDRHDEPPPDFRGGILADDMGLGKTLSMIGLIASDPWEHRPEQPSTRYPGRLRATLLVVPSSLLQQWEGQLIMHVQTSGPNRIQWTKYHGLSRLMDLKLLDSYHIVITSFQTLASEYRKQSNCQSLLYSITWRRLVLDEAHAIRNQNTITAKAVFELEAESRWAMTGTPIQNRISDLSSILQFLRVYPYCNRKVFDADIVRIWKMEDENLALDRLKRLFQCIAIRRHRHSIDLPNRTDLRKYVYLNSEELIAYRQIESPIVDMIDNALRRDMQERGTYMHALLKINSLRQFCNIGLESKASNMECKSPLFTEITTGSDLQAIVDDLLSSGQATCALCNSDVRFVLEEDGSPSEKIPSTYLSECMRLICLICYYQSDTPGIAPLSVCVGHIPCRLSSASIAPTTQLRNRSSEGPTGRRISSKVISLRTELQKLSEEKRYKDFHSDLAWTNA
jgi:SWI/SNF-related matrix-associated actin-dependent regulator of chromatin subfamily A3